MDPSGGGIPNAEIKATSTGTGVVSLTHAGAAGNYRLADLPAGDYVLAVSAPQFSTVTVKDIVVEVSRIATINVTLPIGGAATGIDVVADMAIDSLTPTIGTTFNDRYS